MQSLNLTFLKKSKKSLFLFFIIVLAFIASIPIYNIVIQNKANKCYNEKQYKEALEYYKKILIYKKNNKKIASCYFYLRIYREAIEYYKLASESGEKAENKKIAICYFHLRKYKEAIEYYKLASESGEKAENKKIAICYFHLTEYKEVLKYYKLAFESGEKYEQNDFLLIARTYYLLSRYEKTYLSEAESFFANSQDGLLKKYHAIFLHLLGDICNNNSVKLYKNAFNESQNSDIRAAEKVIELSPDAKEKGRWYRRLMLAQSNSKNAEDYQNLFRQVIFYHMEISLFSVSRKRLIGLLKLTDFHYTNIGKPLHNVNLSIVYYETEGNFWNSNPKKGQLLRRQSEYKFRIWSEKEAKIISPIDTIAERIKKIAICIKADEGTYKNTYFNIGKISGRCPKCNEHKNHECFLCKGTGKITLNIFSEKHDEELTTAIQKNKNYFQIIDSMEYHNLFSWALQ